MEELYKEYSSLVYHYLYGLTNNIELSEELMQDTFYAAIKGIKKFKGECKISVWLCQIAKNKWKDYIKKTSKFKISSIEDKMESLYVENTIIDDINEKNERIKLYKKIHKLDDNTKEVFYLKKYKNKKLIIKSVFLFLVILILSIIIVCSIKNNNINTIFNDMKQTKQGLLELNNYSIETIEHQINFNTKQENWFKNSFYYKDKNYKIMRGMGKEYEEIKNDYLYYGSIDSNKQIQISEKNKKITNLESNYTFITKDNYINKLYTYLEFYMKDYNFILNFVLNMSFDVREERYNGEECYVLKRESKDSYHEVWISKEKKIPVRELDEIYNVQYIEKIYNFTTNNVTDADIKTTDKVEYTVENIKDDIR